MEGVATQHRLVVVDAEVRIGKRGQNQGMPIIKWWKFKEDELKNQFEERVIEEMTHKESVNQEREVNSKIILKAGEKVLSKTSGKVTPGYKESCW